MKLHLEETVELSEFLKRKNMLLIEQLKSLQLKYEEQLNMTSELELFSKGMKALTEKYPNFTIEKLMTRYELLEVTSMSLTKKLSELEDEKQCSDNEKIKQLADFQNKLLFYSEADKRKEKQLQEFNIRINNQKFDKETFSYKEKYFQIFNRIIVLFNKWNTSIRVFYNYNKDDLENENVVLEDPMNILEVMDKMMQISTPQGLQSYLRKIIIAANKLQRNHFKQFVNERFDPEKLFERIDKKMIAMGREKVKTKIFLGNTMEKIFLE